MPIDINALYRYPVKGLSAEPLTRVVLSRGEGFPHDRRFAIARAATRINREQPEWLPKTNFFMLLRDEQLAQLQTHFDADTGWLRVARPGHELFSACITEAAGRHAADAFFTDFLHAHPDGPPRLVEAPGHTFSDAKQRPGSTTYKYVSLINLASVRDLERVAGQALDAMRFRANVHFTGAPAWDELSWVGRQLALGSARLRVVSPITRCLATAVNPTTAERDLDVPRLLQDEYGHKLMGIYAEVMAPGVLAAGDRLALAG